MDMVERVAIALFVLEVGGEGWPVGLTDGAKEHYRKRARAAIEAMRVPTKEMINAASGQECYEDVWIDMIDAALLSEVSAVP